jgi:hypothetical protein
MESESLIALLPGLSYGVIYIGWLQLRNGHLSGSRLLVGGLVAVTLLLFGVRQPLMASLLVLLAMLALLLRLEVTNQTELGANWLAAKLRPWLLVSLLLAAVAVGVS